MSNISKEKRDNLIKKIHEVQKTADEETNSVLNQIISELNRKKYGLLWEEHEEEVDVKAIENIPVFKENKKYNISPKAASGKLNFLLEGDNLHSLMLLEKTHKGDIGVIYIDPPYNTDKNDFIYNDSFVAKDDAFKHSKWLSFMNRRLKIASKLLSKDGIIMISIDDNEYAPLKLLCDEIFGENNRLSTHHIQVRYDNKTLNEKNDWQPVMEYVLIYAKDSTRFKANKPMEEYSIDKFVYEFEELTKGEEFYVKGRKVTVFKKGEWNLTKHKEPATNLLKEVWVSGSIYTGTGNGTMVQNVIEPRIKKDGYGSLYKIDGLGEDGLGFRYFTGPKKEGATRSKMFLGVPLNRSEELETGESTKYKSIPNIYDFSADFGNIRHEGGVPFNSGKKPVKMLKQLINYHPNKNVTVLDFFAGSGSTGHAVLSLNEEDNGNRTFILCTNNENNICKSVTYKRMKNVINGYGKYKAMPANLRFYETCFVPKKTDGSVPKELLKHIKELIQLDYQCVIDNKTIQIALSNEEIDTLFNKGIEECKTLFLSSEVLLTTEQSNYLIKKGIISINIPEYYFSNELREVDEI